MKTSRYFEIRIPGIAITFLMLAAALLFSTLTSTGQQKLKFAHLGIQDGLSHSWAKCLAKDSKGFLWVGTINGLNRYDGRNFKMFKTEDGNSNSLSDNFIQVIKEDSKGNLWVGTYSGGINLFDKKTERFTAFRNDPNNPNSLSDDRIHSILEDSKGRLWVGTEGGLDWYDYQKEQFRHYYLTPNEQHQLITEPVFALFEDSNENLWIGTDNGLYVVQVEERHIKKYNYFEDSPLGLSHKHITSIYEDENGHIWIGTLGGGVNLFDPGIDAFKHFVHSENDSESLSHNSVLCLSGNQNGHLYIGTEGGGVNILDLNTHKIEVFLPESEDPHSINSNSIHALYHDAATEITWIGTYHGGVNYFSKLSKPFRHYKTGVNGLNNSNVLCIREDKSGNIYVGTDGGGVNIVDKDGKDIRYLTHDEKDPGSLMSNAVLSLLIDSKDNIWVGTFNGGLDCLVRKTGKITHFRHDPEDLLSLSGKDVSAIYEDSKGNLWIGTMKGGLNLFDPASQSFQHFQHNPDDSLSIRDNFISGITEDQDGNLLIQTGKSLDIFDPERSVFSRVYDINMGMPITTLEDSQGHVWVGTREALLYFDKDSADSMRFFSQSDGLPSSSITGILEDQEGNLWISTMRGLVKFSEAVLFPDRMQFQVYTVEDGLQGNDFKDQACFKGRDGTLYFGGQNGLNSFRPEEIKQNPIPPAVVLTGFRLFNKEVSFGEGQPLTSPINETEEITLSHKHNVFSFEFSALNFILPEKNRYAYMMEGFEQNWNYVDNQNTATYTNLNPGTYTFKVKASNNDGVWNEAGTSIEIQILPPWWQTTWFRVLILSIVVLSIIAIFQIRLYQLKLRQKVLRRQVEAATIEIQKVNRLLEDQNDTLLDKNHQLTHQNEELEKQSKKIQKLLKEIQELSEMKLRFFTNISHELRTPLTLILGPLENLMAGDKGQSEHVVMHRNAVKLLQLINQLLDFRKIESGNIGLKAQKKDLVAFTKEVYNSFCFLAERKHIHYTFKATPESFDLWFDSEKMEKIITNLLSNAFKYTSENGTITVSLQLFDNPNPGQEHMDITIRDSGSGIPENQIDHIFDLYYQAQNASNLEQAGTGIGLALIKQFVELHHGEILVSSTVGLGTSLTVRLPVGNQHLSPTEITYDPADAHASRYTSYELESHFSEIEEIPSKLQWEYAQGEEPVLLIVEDDPDIRHYITDAFSSSFKITEAVDGKEGLEKALEIIPDLIISDVMMPHLDGFVMCERLKTDEKTSHIPVIMLTAYSGEEKLQEGFSSGADDYVTKPFNINLLKQKIKNIIQTRRNLIEKFSQSTSLDTQKLTSNTADQKFLNKAIEVIEANMDNSDFGVENFSDQFNMSRRNLLRKIKSVTGLSVNEFIKNIRLKKSVQLLHDVEMNISEVAYATGFNDPKYFSKCFKEQFGKSPSEFMAELQR